MKKSYVIFVLIFSCNFYACTNVKSEDETLEEVDTETSVLFTKEAKLLKESITSHLPQIRELAENNVSRSVDSQEELLKAHLKELSIQTVQMLKSYGFRDREFVEFDNFADPRIALIGVMFIGLLETGLDSDMLSPRIKSRSGESGDSGECFSLGKILDCAGRVILIGELAQLLSGAGDCITMTTALRIFKKLL